MTLAEVAGVLGVSRERIRQIEGRILGRLRASLSASVDSSPPPLHGAPGVSRSGHGRQHRPSPRGSARRGEALG